MDDMLFDAFIDHEIQSTKGKNMFSVDRENADNLQLVVHELEDDDGDEEDVCVDNEDLDSIHESDDEEAKNYPKFDPKRESENPDLKLGMIFCSKKEAKFAIQTHCIRRGMAVNFVKNDNIRLWAKCNNDDCRWIIHVAKMTNDSCWQIRTFDDRHNKCFREFSNKSINSTWLAKTFSRIIAVNPKMGTDEFKQEICRTLNVNISRKVAYVAKRKALMLVQGTAQEQYRQIRRYCAELKRSDSRATIVLKLTEDEEGPRFQRLYVCFSACKQGFKDACRRVIGVDGCFLKEQHGGQLLVAVGLDPNNNIFPICYALVERETKDSWTWFLRLLDEDLGISGVQYDFTFMSDKQKGLIPALESLFPDAEHRFCARHLHSNMKRAGFKSLAVKITFWAAAKATRIEEFRVQMNEMKVIDENAYEWLAKKPENQWSRAYFSTSPKSDILLNNMCETFNSIILDAREKPVIDMFETLRNLLMARFQVNREKVKKWKGRICPNIKDVLAKIYLEAVRYFPMKSNEMLYQISRSDDIRDQHSVDLSIRSCSCRRYDLTGIPCKHAVCAIWCKKEDPEMYVHSYYMIETYKRCYAMSILPTNGPCLWPECNIPPPLPPIHKQKLGRPAKMRRREPDEPPPSSRNKLKGVKKFNKCKLCGGSGHNQRTCKGNEDIQQETVTQKIRKEKQHGNRPVNINKPAFVKDGVNFTTVSQLRSSMKSTSSQGSSMNKLILDHTHGFSSISGVTVQMR
ncbi:uncharacterized protein [Primulina eburnea]|uniref:uncharacterized protein n=1 Tax=Primulina eburnea TaxID=1245227 RepID=UPI003C6C8400